VPTPTALDRFRFTSTIFLSAFLLFWVQLILGKYLLPWFGGTPAVWTTCMLFFQWLLLAGYVYAHALTKYARPVTQAVVHCTVLFASIGSLSYLSSAWSSPIAPSAIWRPYGTGNPVLRITELLSVAVGLPYFCLSTTSPLLQEWHRRVHRDSPYRLYAISNAGSFLALLTFPFLFEPALSLIRQGWLWSIAYLAFVVGCFACALRLKRLFRTPAEANDSASAVGSDVDVQPADSPGLSRYMLWFGFSACASAFFLATTNQLCQDVAVVPLLWVMPLSVYLLSFILCFEHQRWYMRQWFHTVFAIALCAVIFILFGGGHGSLSIQIAVYLLTLFAACMVCNGELARIKPEPNRLTSFYLCIAIGGSFGGILVALVAPKVFHAFWEYQLALWATAALLLGKLLREPDSWIYRIAAPVPVLLLAVGACLLQAAILGVSLRHQASDYFAGAIAAALFVRVFVSRHRSLPEKARRTAAHLCGIASLATAAFLLVASGFAHSGHAIARFRNFYGAFGIIPREIVDSRGAAYSLVHGRIEHGFQLRAEPYDRIPTAYYGTHSGVGLAIAQATAAARSARRSLNVGTVGLGIGTLATYARPGDTFRFYEINPQVIAIATNPAYFTFLAKCAGQLQIVPGDARVSLEREAGRGELQNFDVLVLDAFSGDAVPVHLLTLEAFAVYRKHLRPQSGILAIHITNSYLDLRPVVFAAAAHAHLNSRWIQSQGDGLASSDSEWMLLSEGELPKGSVASSPASAATVSPRFRPWTDDYSNLLQVLKK
jgi:hypothetical protein